MSEHPAAPGHSGMRPAPPLPTPPPPYRPGPAAAGVPSPFTAPYAAPAQGTFAPPPAPRPRPTLGVIALVLGILAVVVPAALAGAAAFTIGEAFGDEWGPQRSSPDGAAAATGFDLAFLAPVRGDVLVAEVVFWAGTAAGVAALALGIVAAVTGRGRIVGILGAAAAVAGPLVYGSAVYAAVWVGIIAAAGADVTAGVGGGL